MEGGIRTQGLWSDIHMLQKDKEKSEDMLLQFRDEEENLAETH